MREWWIRLLAVGRRGRRDREFDEEMRFHLDELTRAFVRRGFDPPGARLAAERELGGINRTRQAWRDQRSWAPLEEMLQDARYGIRVLRRSKGLTTVAGVMLAVAVAATTSLFTVVDAVLLAPLPYPRAGQLAVIYEAFLTQQVWNASVTPGTFLEWQDRARSFAAMTAVDTRQENLISDGEPVQVTVGAVSHGFATTVAVLPITGRMFGDSEFAPGHERVALISHELWSTRYGRAPVEGRSMVLDDQLYTIVGVMPRGFLFPSPQPQVWVPLPLTASDRDNRTGHGLFVVARVRDGIRLAAAAAELHAVAAALRRELPQTNKEWDVTVIPAREDMVGETTGVLRAMMGAVALLLLVACGNVAGLLLTHGVSRSRELAVRVAVGASRARVVRQLLTESGLLAAVAAIAGVLLAWMAQPLVDSLRPADLLTWKPIALDGRALGFATILALASGVLFGTLPAVTASRADFGAAASLRAAGHRASRVRQLLIVVEVALAVVLVAVAALLAQTLAHLTAVDPGFRPDGVVTMRVSLPAARYGEDRSVDRFYRSLFERIRTIPGVRAAGAIQSVPLSGDTSVRPYFVEGAPIVDPPPIAHYRIVTPGYLEAMRIPMQAGRAFSTRDTVDRPLVVIINQTLRRAAFGDRDPIGTRITFGGGRPPDVLWAEIIGVVGDVRHFGAAEASPPEMYWPAAQIGVVPGETLKRMRRGLTLVVAVASGDPLAVVAPVSAAVRGVDPDQPISNVRTMTSLMSASMWLSRAATWLLTIFGSAALTFALLGVFGAASHAVRERRRELALRLALGAAPQGVARLALAGALTSALGGIAAGVTIAVALGRVVSTLLGGIKGTDDALTLGVVSAGLAAAAALASYIPARAAGRLDPMEVLRVE